MSKPFKTIYEFTITKKEKSEEIIPNEDGTKTIKPVEKDVPYKFYIKRPSGAEKSAAELYSFRTYGEAVSTGVITFSILQKRIADEGGLFSREENKIRNQLIDQLKRELEDYKIIAEIKEEDRNDGQKETLSELDKSIQALSKKLKEYNDIENDLGMTAESLTQRKILVWWLLFLLFKDSAEEKVPFFSGADFEDRQESYNDIQDEEDEFNLEVINKALIAIRCWMSLGKVDDDILKKVMEG